MGEQLDLRERSEQLPKSQVGLVSGRPGGRGGGGRAPKAERGRGKAWEGSEGHERGHHHHHHLFGAASSGDDYFQGGRWGRGGAGEGVPRRRPGCRRLAPGEEKDEEVDVDDYGNE